MKINEKPLEEIIDELNSALDGLFYSMEKKKTDSGCVTLKISVDILRDKEERILPDGTILENIIKIPHFKYDITRTLKMSDKIKLELKTDHELIFDEMSGSYDLKAIDDGQIRMEI